MKTSGNSQPVCTYGLSTLYETRSPSYRLIPSYTESRYPRNIFSSCRDGTQKIMISSTLANHRISGSFVLQTSFPPRPLFSFCESGWLYGSIDLKFLDSPTRDRVITKIKESEAQCLRDGFLEAVLHVNSYDQNAVCPTCRWESPASCSSFIRILKIRICSEYINRTLRLARKVVLQAFSFVNP